RPSRVRSSMSWSWSPSVARGLPIVSLFAPASRTVALGPVVVRETLPVKSRAYLVVEIARDGVERAILAPAGDATPRVEEAPATGDLHRGDFEESPVADHELARGVDHGLSSCHASDLRCAIDSTHHAR